LVTVPRRRSPPQSSTAQQAEGLIDPTDKHRKGPIKDHVEQYKLSLRGRICAKHFVETIRRVETVIAGCKFRSLQDVTADAVGEHLQGLRSYRERAAGHEHAFITEAVAEFPHALQPIPGTVDPKVAGSIPVALDLTS